MLKGGKFDPGDFHLTSVVSVSHLIKMKIFICKVSTSINTKWFADMVRLTIV